MKAPGSPANEVTRIDTLRSLNILDSSPEERFDRITRLARRLFGVPMALVSLVDADRQWFKSNFGIDATETTRDVSFCGHAILGDDIFTVPDTFLDERFLDNPLVQDGPKIRFYAGCPISVPNGSKLGTLCVLDREPREFDDDDRELLKDLTRMAEQEIAAVQLATMDELTMLSNRRGFEALAQHALNVCKRLDKPACVFFFDLDSFKQINDRFGHAEGDRALTGFSNLMKSVFRDSDVIGRLGGDEFVVFLTNTTMRESEAVLKRLDEAVAEYNEHNKRGYDLGYSVGMVEYLKSVGHGIADLLKIADERMYENKKKKKG